MANPAVPVLTRPTGLRDMFIGYLSLGDLIGRYDIVTVIALRGLRTALLILRMASESPRLL